MSEINHLLLCIKDIQGDIKSHEKEILTQWLNHSPENQKLYQQYKSIHQLEHSITIDGNIDQEAVWNDMYHKIKMKEQKTQSVKNSILSIINNKGQYKYMRFGFALCCSIILIFTTIYIRHYFFSVETEFIATGNSEKRTIILPDQSKVILNYDSELKYPEAFNENERSVQLNGEAFFSIRKSTKPFIIRSINADIHVLGTTFNVWTRGNKTRVAVKRGQVKLNNIKDENNFVLLNPDQMSFVIEDQSPHEPEMIDLAIDLDWLENKLVFEKTLLSEAIAEIERFYDVSIQLDEHLQNQILTAQFTDISIESVLEKICLVYHARYSDDSKIYYITH